MLSYARAYTFMLLPSHMRFRTQSALGQCLSPDLPEAQNSRRYLCPASIHRHTIMSLSWKCLRASTNTDRAGCVVLTCNFGGLPTEPFRPKVAVLMPTRRPPESSRAPPELPPFIGASVCRPQRREHHLPLRFVKDDAALLRCATWL